jgi:hypothetical protein
MTSKQCNDLTNTTVNPYDSEQLKEKSTASISFDKPNKQMNHIIQCGCDYDEKMLDTGKNIWDIFEKKIKTKKGDPYQIINDKLNETNGLSTDELKTNIKNLTCKLYNSKVDRQKKLSVSKYDYITQYTAPLLIIIIVVVLCITYKDRSSYMMLIIYLCIVATCGMFAYYYDVFTDVAIILAICMLLLSLLNSSSMISNFNFNT